MMLPYQLMSVNLAIYINYYLFSNTFITLFYLDVLGDLDLKIQKW
jgi:hypothetical protein